MKIVCLIHKLTYSGAPKIMIWLANKLSKNGHEISLVACYKTEFNLAIDRNVKLIELNVSQSNNKFWRNTIQLDKIGKTVTSILESIQPDIVISFLDLLGFWILRKGVCSRLHIKLVVSERVDPYSRKGLTGLIKKRTIEKADAFVFQTEHAKRFYNISNKPSSVIPNPIRNNDRLKSINYDVVAAPKVIVSIGRISIKQKRQDVMLKAFSFVSKKHPEYLLKIYGDGKDEKRISKLIKHLGISGKAFLCGKTDDPINCLLESKIFVLTSDYEGIPNALIEALQCGIPSVSTDCSPGGARLLINSGVNGFIVEKGNAVEVANRINELIDNNELCRLFSMNARKMIGSFDETNIFSKWETFLLEILG